MVRLLYVVNDLKMLFVKELLVIDRVCSVFVRLLEFKEKFFCKLLCLSKSCFKLVMFLSNGGIVFVKLL